MKIFEITDKFKVIRSTPQEVQLQSPANKTTITTTPSALSQNPTDPNLMVLNLSNPAQASSMPAQAQDQKPGMPGQAQTPGTPAQAPDQAQGQTPGMQSPDQAQGQTPGMPAQAPAAGQQLPQVGAEVELPDNIGSTVQSETFDDKDLMNSGKNKDIGGPNGGDETDDFIDDVVDHKWEKNAGRSNRNIIKPEPVRESAELIAMLTIAGLR